MYIVLETHDTRKDTAEFELMDKAKNYRSITEAKNAIKRGRGSGYAVEYMICKVEQRVAVEPVFDK